MNRHFVEGNIEMANKHMVRCSTSLAIRELQINSIQYQTVIK